MFSFWNQTTQNFFISLNAFSFHINKFVRKHEVDIPTEDEEDLYNTDAMLWW